MSLANKTIKSSLFILLIRLIQRSIGIISYLILARLLTPEDFGLVTIATMLVFLCDVLSESGAQQYIVQKENVDNDDINTAWTLGIILKTVLAIVLILMSPYIADFFVLPELAFALQVIAIILPISALTNPALSVLKKNFDYKPFLKLTVYEKLGSFVFTMILAITLQSFWAMILGVVFSYLIKLVGSYLIVQHKSQLTLVKVKEQWSFSKWVLLKAIMGYSKSEFDTVFVSKLFSVEALGGFSMMKNLSTTPGREIIRPLVEPLLASFSKVKANVEELNDQIIKSINILLMITVPVCAFIISFDRQIVELLFDEKWYVYADLLGVMSVFIINYSIGAVLHEALVCLKKVKFIFYYDAITFLITIGLILVFLGEGGLDWFTFLRIAIAIGSTVILIFFVYSILRFNLKNLIILNIPIFLTLAITSVFRLDVSVENNFVSILVNGSLFAIEYLALFAILMWIFRCFSFVKSTQTWLLSTARGFIKK